MNNLNDDYYNISWKYIIFIVCFVSFILIFLSGCAKAVDQTIKPKACKQETIEHSALSTVTQLYMINKGYAFRHKRGCYE